MSERRGEPRTTLGISLEDKVELRELRELLELKHGIGLNDCLTFRFALAALRRELTEEEAS